jgi:predicted metal-dependent phosphoesterase TrpH
MIDLHMHSNFSDGSMSPTELVEHAGKIGLKAIALTDHDTIDGVHEFVEAGKKYNILTIPGVEISVDTSLPNTGHLHMLGLFINYTSSELKDTLDYLRNERNLRAKKIVNKLNELDVPISMLELLREAGEGSIGRPHVAKILVEKGMVSTIQEAFDVYLAKGKPAYMDKVKLGEIDAIRMIKNAGGLAILAHPHLMKFDSYDETKEKIQELRALGVDGLEIYYSGMPMEMTKKLLRLVMELDFVISGGSDFHGSNKDNIQLGTGLGDLHIQDEVYHQLKRRWQSKNQRIAVP